MNKIVLLLCCVIYLPNFAYTQNPFDTIRVLRTEKIGLIEENEKLESTVTVLKRTNSKLRREKQMVFDSLVTAKNRIAELEAIDRRTKEENEELKILYANLKLYVEDLEMMNKELAEINGSQKLIIDHQARELDRKNKIAASYKKKYLSSCSKLDLVIKGEKTYTDPSAEYSTRKLQSIGLKICYAMEYEEGDTIPKLMQVNFKLEKLLKGGTDIVEERTYNIRPTDFDENIVYYESNLETIEKSELENFGEGTYRFEFTIGGEIIKAGYFTIGKKEFVSP